MATETITKEQVIRWLEEILKHGWGKVEITVQRGRIKTVYHGKTEMSEELLKSA